MSQERFEATRGADWARLDADLAAAEKADRRAIFARRSPKADVPADLPARYRRLCQDLALARHRRYAPPLVDRLNRLALRGHQRLYRSRSLSPLDALGYLATGFPADVRRSWRLALIASLLLFGPMVLMGFGVAARPELADLVVDPATLAEMEAIYDPQAEHMLHPRGADSDLLMFGFYIRNNIGIAFRTFAGGLLFCVGALFFLVYNGLVIGAVAGHIVHVGYGETFFPFAIGHGSFELTAICLSGMTGLKVGLAVLSPGRRTRAAALAAEARATAPMVGGFAAMLVVAAALEAFWSSATAIPAEVRLAVGAALWVTVGAWLGLGGRARGS